MHTSDSISYVVPFSNAYNLAFLKICFTCLMIYFGSLIGDISYWIKQ